MKLDDAVREFLATKPDSGSPDQPVGQRRALIRAGSDSLFDAFGASAGDVYAHAEVELRRGDVTIRARVYRPNQAAGLPIHVFLHGGGFWLGSIDERVNDAMCRQRCREVGCLVVAVEYRLAPEHRFPTPVEDCYAALIWAVEHANDIGGDPDNVSIGGVSAGANLAAAVALAARDRQGPRLRLQVLEVPPLDLTLDTMRASGVGDEYGITVDEMRLSCDLYLRSPDDARDALASPLLAPDLSGLPPARIMTAEFDPLWLDGKRYAARLGDAGVAASHGTYPGAVHGSLALTGSWPPARSWQHDVVEALREAHAPDRAAAPSLSLPH
jgi:acetyl esterase